MKVRTLVVLALVAGCKDKNQAAPVDAGASTPALSASAVAAIADAGKARDGGMDATARAEVLKDLNDGRRLSRAKDWTGAIAAFNRALAISPDDVRVLSELGWAEFNANDLAKAEAANTRALANAKEPALRAPILYNVGRVAQQKGDKAAAVRAYRASLALRTNAEVRSRLVSLGNDAGADDDENDGTVGGPCAKGFSSPGTVCQCLAANVDKEEIFIPDGDKPLCKQDMGRTLLGDPRISTLTFGVADNMPGETRHFVVVRETDQTRLVSTLGSDYIPGAFGVDNEMEILGGTARNVAGHVVIVIKTKKNDVDLNMAGLEACTDTASQETVCALSDDHGGSKCTPPIPITEEAGCGPNAALDPKDLDDDTRSALAELKKTASKSSVKTSWAIADDGTVTVTVNEGSRELVPANVLLPHKIFVQ